MQQDSATDQQQYVSCFACALQLTMGTFNLVVVFIVITMSVIVDVTIIVMTDTITIVISVVAIVIVTIMSAFLLGGACSCTRTGRMWTW